MLSWWWGGGGGGRAVEWDLTQLHFPGVGNLTINTVPGAKIFDNDDK